jgi:hypothetical protein
MVNMRAKRSSESFPQMTETSAKQTLLGTLDLTPLSNVTVEVHARAGVV